MVNIADISLTKYLYCMFRNSHSIMAFSCSLNNCFSLAGFLQCESRQKALLTAQASNFPAPLQPCQGQLFLAYMYGEGVGSPWAKFLLNRQLLSKKSPIIMQYGQSYFQKAWNLSRCTKKLRLCSHSSSALVCYCSVAIPFSSPPPWKWELGY